MTVFAFAVNTAMAVMTLVASIAWVLYWRKSHKHYAGATSALFATLCLYWSLIAVSSGPAPVWDRGDIAIFIRGVLVVATLLLGTSIALLFFTWDVCPSPGCTEEDSSEQLTAKEKEA